MFKVLLNKQHNVLAKDRHGQSASVDEAHVNNGREVDEAGEWR
jgi:hypothetical protein